MKNTYPQRGRPSGVEGDRGTWLERNESQITIVGPLAIGIAAACYGAISEKLTLAGALGAGWVLWQLSLIIVFIWIVANTEEDSESVDRMRLGYKPRRAPQNRR